MKVPRIKTYLKILILRFPAEATLGNFKTKIKEKIFHEDKYFHKNLRLKKTFRVENRKRSFIRLNGDVPAQLIKYECDV